MAALAVSAVPAVASAMPSRVAPRQPGALLAKVVVIGVAGLRWSDVQASPELAALVDQAHVGSISVKTSTQQTCPADGWLTVNAGTRTWVSGMGGCPALPVVDGDRVDGWQRYGELQAQHHTGAQLGRLGSMGDRLCGFGPGAALAVADSEGRVANWRERFDPAALAGCDNAVVDAGAMPLREGRAEARARIAQLVQQARAQDAWVLLVGIGEEQHGVHRETLVAMQLPPDGSDRAPRWLTSESTRRPGLIQLTDITATLLRGGTGGSGGTAEPADGAPVGFTGGRHTDPHAVILDRLDANQRFEQPRPMLVAVGATLLVAQLAALGWFLLRRGRASRRTAVALMLTQGGFFSAVFLTTVLGWWRWPAPGLSLYLTTIGVGAVVAGASYALLRCRAALGVAAAAYLTLVVDGVLGTPLQVGSMFADGPVIGGRFYGFGNTTFAVLAVGTLVAAAWAGSRLLDRSRPLAAAAVLAVGGAAVLADGVPGWGTDFGGVISLTPAVLLLAWYAWRGAISLRAVLAIGITGFVVVAALAIADYSRPPEQRTHFGAFVARLLDGDAGDVFVRKISMSLGFLRSPAGWVSFVGVLLAMAACVVPQKVPSVSFRRFVDSAALVRPTLLALALCGLIGMLLNDAGVAVPAVMAGFALPLLVAHLMQNFRPSVEGTENTENTGNAENMSLATPRAQEHEPQ